MSGRVLPACFAALAVLGAVAAQSTGERRVARVGRIEPGAAPRIEPNTNTVLLSLLSPFMFDHSKTPKISCCVHDTVMMPAVTI